MKKAFLFAVCMLSSFFIGFFYKDYNKDTPVECVQEETVVPTLTEVTYKEETSLKGSIDKVYDAVVVIETYDQIGNKMGTGSGFFYKKDDFGYIITNNHVIDSASAIKTINNLNEEYGATLLGKDEYLDVAILKVDKEAALSVAELGSASDCELGDTVFTVGSPLGMKYRGTVTKGIISGTDRKVSVKTGSGNYIMEVLQTDAAINPGNSGGPLVSLGGKVIGVNSLKLVEDEIEGMGFAIPIDLIQENLEQLEKGEVHIRPILGIEISDVNNLVNRYQTTGIYINKVEKNYPASAAGLLQGDFIIKVDDYVIEDSAHFRYILYKYKIGEKVTITYIRDGVTYQTELLLDKGV